MMHMMYLDSPSCSSLSLMSSQLSMPWQTEWFCFVQTLLTHRSMLRLLLRCCNLQSKALHSNLAAPSEALQRSRVHFSLSGAPEHFASAVTTPVEEILNCPLHVVIATYKNAKQMIEDALEFISVVVIELIIV